eukprot:3835720-Rhodomonas_salina.1
MSGEMALPGVVRNLLPFLLYQGTDRHGGRSAKMCQVSLASTRVQGARPGTRVPVPGHPVRFNNFYDPNKPREHDNRSFMK